MPREMTASDAIHALLRLWRTFVHRKRLVISVTGVCVALGMIYYLTAPRYYRSTAKLLINERKADELSSMGEQLANENLMANQRETLVSPRVVRNALDNLLPLHQIDLRSLPRREWVDEVTSRLHAKASRMGSFIEVSYTSLDPEAAAGMVDAVVDSYLAFVDANHKGSASETIEALDRRLQQVQAELLENQTAMQTLQQRVGHLGSTESATIIDPAVQRALKLNESLINVQQRRIDLQARLSAVEASVRQGHDLQRHLSLLERSLGEHMISAALGMTPMDLAAVRDREEELIDVQTEIENLSPHLGSNNPKIVELQNKARNLQNYLSEYRARAGQRMASLGNEQLEPLIRNMLTQAIEQAWFEEREIETAYQAARHMATQHNADILEMENRRRSVERLEAHRDELFSQIGSINTYQSQGPIQAVVVKDALPSEKPVSPQLKFVAAFSLLGGLFLGGALAYIQDVLDDRFTSPEELATQLNVPILALIQSLETLPGQGLDTVHTHMRPSAVSSEAFRTLRTSLALNAEVSDRILVSSAEPGDGKTTVSANLAVAFAQAGKRTLVIDADLRRPGMTTLLGLKRAQGVVDILSSPQPPAELAPQYVVKTDEPNLHVLPAGLRRPNPAELLASPAFIELLAWADSQYDQILVDCPPVLAVSDAQIVGRLVDGAILVVRPEKNHRRLVARACESFHSTGSHVIGVVANAVTTFSAAGYGYGYGYTYGNDDDQSGAESSYETPSSQAA